MVVIQFCWLSPRCKYEICGLQYIPTVHLIIEIHAEGGLVATDLDAYVIWSKTRWLILLSPHPKAMGLEIMNVKL
jgi:hypothetical protein